MPLVAPFNTDKVKYYNSSKLLNIDIIEVLKCFDYDYCYIQSKLGLKFQKTVLLMQNNQADGLIN